MRIVYHACSLGELCQNHPNILSFTLLEEVDKLDCCIHAGQGVRVHHQVTDLGGSEKIQNRILGKNRGVELCYLIPGQIDFHFSGTSSLECKGSLEMHRLTASKGWW